jgi:type II secretory pathway predicted ATPase ExeA/septal ring-binding cell division protein DamX
MIKKRQDMENIEKSPFQGETTLDNYFSGANRGEVLSQMKEAVQNGVPLMVLTGEEGSGKTTLCRLFEQEASASCITVFFPQAVDSFEDTLSVIAMKLEMDTAIAEDGVNAGQVLDELTVFLLSHDVDLLVIFDEAENIFLATLEKIYKMLDRVKESGAGIHILFSGRKTFLENCDQLSLSDFQNTDQCHFELSPLSINETADYLHSCAVRITGTDVSNVFTDDVITNIYGVSKGNFRLINILGDESVKTPAEDTSFMVLLKDLKEGIYPGEGTSGRGISFDFMRKFTAYLPWIGGGAICLLILFFLFSPGGDEGDVGQDAWQIEKSEMVSAGPEEQVPSPVEKQPSFQAPEQNITKEQKVETLPEGESIQPEIDRVPREVGQGVAETPEKAESETGGEVFEKETEQTPQMQIQPNVAKEENESVPLQHLIQAQKKITGLSPKPESGIAEIEPQTEIHKDKVPTASTAVEKLYRERLLAGTAWEKREKENMYTVQLMALASRDAEKNLKKMLAQVDYRQEAGNFFIFKQATTPGHIYVFYGEYPSIERARLVKNSLPQFLRDQKPYALSIKSAMAKIKK